MGPVVASARVSALILYAKRLHALNPHSPRIWPDSGLIRCDLTPIWSDLTPVRCAPCHHDKAYFDRCIGPTRRGCPGS
jgi:hypothetical protein